MPSMNILADFQSAIQSINRITRSLSDFKRDTYDIINLYDEDNPEPYLNAIDCMFANLSYREMYLIIALLGDEKTLVNLLEKSEDQPSQIIEKLFFTPIR
jgi:hypothetical protein